MRYFLIAGEASGDLHGSNLIKGLATEDPQAEFRFWGGDLMAEASGVAPSHHYRDDAVMGLTDVLARAGKLVKNIKACKKEISAYNPDVVILIDYPGFNFRIARYAHTRGYKVFYYIAPKTWASREGRNRKLRRYVDRLFIVFPFEKNYFESRGIPYIYKGNPLLDAVDSHKYVSPSEHRYIALLAGSRKGEISRMMPVYMQIADQFPQYSFIIAGAPSRDGKDYAGAMAGHPNVSLVFGRTYDILKFADAAVINSGTASLEAALIGTPQVVCWTTSALTAFIARKILRVLSHIKYISLGNLIIDNFAFRELIQEDFTVENVAKELHRLTEDRVYRDSMLEDYAQIRRRLGGSGASRSVASAMIGQLCKDCTADADDGRTVTDCNTPVR